MLTAGGDPLHMSGGATHMHEVRESPDQGRMSARVLGQRSRPSPHPLGGRSGRPTGSLRPSRIPVGRAPAWPPIQRKPLVGGSDQADEREADAVADAVVRMVDAPPIRAASVGIQRKCAACEAGRPCSACAEEDGKTIQTKRAPSVDRNPVPAPDVALRAAGRGGTQLPGEVRSHFELRFGSDFGHVRVHDGVEAAEGARSVHARAYTVGSDIVFGAGEYTPGTPEGQRLLAHELVHTIQQAGSPTTLQRACLSGAQCTKPATLESFVADTTAKPENVSKAAKRAAACGKVPRDASCTSDGHGAAATALTALLKSNYPSRLGYVAGIFVNKDMPADWGAVTQSCASFTPPLPGGFCTFVPDTLEAQAKQFSAGAATIAGVPRQEWLTATLATLTHETEHARFDAAAPIARPSATACKFEDHESNLSEMAAALSEMHVYYRAALARPEKDRFKAFFAKFDDWVKNGSEDISGIVTNLRCKCECADADYYVRKTAESVSTNQKWDTNELTMIHNELRDPKWGLGWPVAPPAAVDVNDLPTVAPAPFKLE